MDATELVAKLQDFFEKFYYAQIAEAARTGTRSLVVNFADIAQFDIALADMLLDEPEEFIKAAELAIAQLETTGDTKCFAVRFRNISLSSTLLIRDIRSHHLNKFIRTEGIVRNKGDVRPQVTAAKFECPSCGNNLNVLQLDTKFKEPNTCSCGRKGKFRLLSKELVDAQGLVLEEVPEQLEGGAQPKRIKVLLKNDLVSPLTEKKTNPGSRIIITGVVKEVPQITKQGGQSTTFDIIFETNHVEPAQKDFTDIKISPEEEKKIKELADDPKLIRILTNAVAPSIFGHEKIKESLVLQLAGGVRKTRDDGITTRGDIHILLVGDPGSGKTQLLKRVAHIAPRGRFISGKGVSGAGLTASVVRDEFLGGFSLEAGALVLTNLGVCCTTSDAQFILQNGKRMTFEQLFATTEKNILRPNFKILALNNETLKIEPFSIKQAIKIKNDKKLFKIKTRTGRELTLTEDNEVLIVRNSKIIWIPAGCLNKNDFIAVPKKITVHTTDNFNKDFAYICGLIATDGHISINNRHAKTTFYNTDDTLIRCFKEKMSALGITFSCRKQPSGRKSMIDGRVLVSRKDLFSVDNSRKAFAQELMNFGIPCGNKSIKNPLENKILSYSDQTLCSFMRGVFDGDGSIRENPAEIVITSGILKNARLFQEILLQIGIVSSVERSTRSWHCAVRGTDNCFKWLEKIGTNHTEKLKTFKMLKRQELKDRIDILPNHQEFFKDIIKKNRWKLGKNLFKYIWNYSHQNVAPSKYKLTELNKRLHNEYINKHVESDILWDKITFLNEVESEFVYDFTMNGTNNFVANNIIMHNCIDELDKMDKEDTAAMHEALEGQSYHPNTEVILADGTRTTIGSFVDGIMEKMPQDVVKGVNCEFFFPENQNVLTTDFQKVYTSTVKRISRHSAPDTFYKITFSNGRHLLVTPEHPMFVYKNGFLEEISASAASVGMTVPAPRRLPLTEKEIILKQPDKSYHHNKFYVLPKNLSPKMARLLGYIVTEGHSHYQQANRSYEIGVSNTNPLIIKDVEALFHNIFKTHITCTVQPANQRQKATLDLFTVRCCSHPIYDFFTFNFPEIMKKAASKRAPACLFGAQLSCVKEFLAAAFLGDGVLETDDFGYSTASRALAEDYQDLLLRLGIPSIIREEHRETCVYFKTVVTGSVEEKQMFVNTIVDSKDTRYPRIVQLLARASQKFNQRDPVLPEHAQAVHEALLQLHMEDGYLSGLLGKGHTPSKKTILPYVQRIQDRLKDISHTAVPGNLRMLTRIPVAQLAAGMNRSASHIYNCEEELHHEHENYTTVLLQAVENKVKYITELIRPVVDFLQSDIRILRIIDVEQVKNTDANMVYDITVLPHKSFISQGVVLHNTVTISKANIQATLRCETTVLAAANPKFGRFDPYDTISNQITLAPTLINRFDLIFPIKDVPDQKKDEKMAKFILALHKNSSVEQADLTTDFLRKYIAFARQNFIPQLTDSAIQEIEEYYIKMRASSTGAGVKSIPISARQLEALVRLSEASAKLHLRSKVLAKDAKKAVEIVDYYLRQVAYDEKTGTIDIDRIATDTSAQTRNKIIIIKEIVAELEGKHGKAVPINEVVKAAGDKDISETEADEIIQKLKRAGDMFEPRPGFVSRI